MMQQIKTKVTVVSNEEGGAAFIGDKQAAIVVMQRIETRHFKNKVLQEIVSEVRMAELVDTAERILLLNKRPGDELPGNIYIKQQLQPLSEEDEQQGLLIDSNKKIVTYRSNPVWQLSFYSENDNEDTILVDYTDSSL